MALEVKWDLVEGGEIEQHAASGKRIVRSGFVKGITTATVTSSKLALPKLIDNLIGLGLCPNFGDIYDPLYPNYRCVFRNVRGVSGNGSMARIFAHFETSRGGTPFETFAIEDSSTPTLEPATIFPGIAKPLRCSLSTAAPTYGSSPPESEISITVALPRSLRTLIIYGLFADRPSVSVLGALNTVNNATWQGLGKARWKCDAIKCAYSNRDGLYRVTAGFLTKGDGLGDDWSTYEIPIDPRDGKRARPDQAKLADEYNKPYEYAVMSDRNSIFHAGLMPLRNFTAIFGNEFSIGD